MKQKRHNRTPSGITRREFIQYSAATGAVLSLPGLLAGCGGDSDSDSDSPTPTPTPTETRTYYFDLAHADPSHDFRLKVGAQYLPLAKMDDAARAAAREANPLLSLVPDENLTHWVEDAQVPSEAIVLCWVVGEDPGATDGSWDMPLMFYHLPTSALDTARDRPNANSAPGAGKFRLYEVAADLTSLGGDRTHLLEDALKNPFDQATALVFNHPEMLSGEPDSASHIQKNIISANPLTFDLAGAISNQGSASEDGGWATQEVYLDDNGQPYLNSQGQKQYFPRWSDETMQAAGPAMGDCLKDAKDDTTLGVNVTGLDPTADNSQQTQGKIWAVRNGITTVNAAVAAELGTGYDYSFDNHSSENGYHVKIVSVDDQRNVTIEVENKYLRYLGLYIRYVDAGDNPIAVDDLPTDTLDHYPNWGESYYSDYDLLAEMIRPELVVLGIPIKSDKQQFVINVPLEAAKVLVLAGGLGHSHGVTAFPDIVHKPGTGATAIMNLALPAVFLALSAASGYVTFMKSPAAGNVLRTILTLIFDIVFATIMVAEYSDPHALVGVAKDTGLLLIKSPSLAKDIDTFLSEGEAEDQVPVVGTILQAVAALGLVASLAQTIAEVARSPKVYEYSLTFTHDIGVTIYHDPDDFEFPATATHYELKAFFDKGTPWTSGRIEMPGTSWSDPLQHTFSKVPYGGKVQIAVGFYSDTEWLAGKGKTEVVANDDSAASLEITIEEQLVPLTTNTRYHHKEKTVLDQDGNLLWQAGAAPTATNTDLSCLNQNGDLCQLACITVSERFAAAGYSWKAFSTDVVSCDSGGHGQLYQFANMSIAQTPEDGHKRSGCGSSELVRVVYDLKDSPDSNFYLDTSGGNRLVRQIRLALDQLPSFDGPDSNKAWGAFSNPSDALLLHPQRKLISISSAFDKIEVLDLPDAAVPDSEAPLARVHSATGTREGLIHGPICAAVAADGTILVLESENRRIQAFDLGGNPAPHFGANKDKYFVPLQEESTTPTYLDLAVEYVGYLYVLSSVTNQGLYEYRLDIYTPQGDFLARTTGVNAAKLAVDLWRNAYSLNFEQLRYPDGTLPTVTEPSVSQWIPSTPT
jgi:hypothetical protein